LLLLALSLALLGATTPLEAATPPPGFEDVQLVSTSSVSGASLPVAIAYEPGTDDLWVLEKGGGSSEGTARVRVRDAVSELVSTALTLDCVDSQGERGLLGIAFSPDYLEAGGASRYVYLFYSRRITSAGTCSINGQAAGVRNRVSRFLESGGSLSGEEVILPGPYLSGATNHNGGTVRFANDGTLFISIGDNDTDSLSNPASRDLNDLRGKLLRVNPDGSIPDDNPFVGDGGVLPEIWAWGLRNPYRFTFDDEIEAPVIADVGENTWEAVYLGVAGADYGYPCVEGSTPFRNCDPDPPDGSVTAPIFEYGHGSQTPPVSGNSITGGPVYRHTAFPAEYDGAYFFGDYVDSWIRRGHFDETGQLVDVELFLSGASSVVDMAVSPDGCLTWVGISGGVRQTCYVGGANSQPEAVAIADPTSGLANLDVDFTGSDSDDPDGDPLLYSWDFDHGPNSSLDDPSHLYTSNGVYEAVLTVDDQQGEDNSVDSSAPIRIVVGNRAPTPTITAPTPGARYNAGDTINFSGSATDPEDDTLPASALAWTVVFHHGSHTHPFRGPITDITAGSFDIPAEGEDANDVFYRIHLTATDSGAPLGSVGALSSTTSVDVTPNLVRISLAANPPGFGIELEYDQQSHEAPMAFDSVAGFPRTINAPSSQTTGGREFFFQGWSDAGAAEHEISPTQDTVYTASFAVNCTAGSDLVLDTETVTTVQDHEACNTITAGPAYVVSDGGDVTFTAGSTIILVDGFSVEGSGTFRAINLPNIP
jgi:glucose/arabinose dehydrogenase